MSRILLAAAVLTLAQPAAAQPTAPVVVGQTFLTSGLDPAEGAAGWALASHGVAEKLFTVDRSGRVVGQLAMTSRREDASTWIVTLAEGRRFSDGAPVTAAEVAAALARTVERNPAARSTVGVVRFTPIDALTLRVVTERPTPVLASVLAEWPFAVYRRDGERFVFTGPWAARAFRAGSTLELEPNAHVAGAATRPAVTLRRFADAQALALALRAGELDLAFNLPVESRAMLAGAPGVTVKSFPVAYQYMAWLNTRRPPFDDLRVRRAVAAAIDRTELVAAMRGGEPSASAYAREFPFAAEAPPPAPDRAAVDRLLDEAGWRRGAGGVRTRDGRPLRVTLWAYPQRPDLVTLQPVLRARLAALGFAVETRVADDPTRIARAGEFDILLWAQHTAPAGDPAFFVNLFLRSGGANNFAGWSSGALDAAAAALDAAANAEERVSIARRVQAILAEEAPVVFLATPVWHVGLSARLAGYEPWGSDYYVLRPDLPALR
jgi:peptide/nickel transport system substrate-binding protein